jgi:hypothetical protein
MEHLIMRVGLSREAGGKIIYAARIGYASQGVVYAVLGVLALLAAFGESKGRLTDGKGAVQAIGDQPLGGVLLWVTAAGLAWKRPGVPTQWTRVIDRNPEAMKPDPLPGYVWLQSPGKVLHVEERVLEFMWNTTEGGPSA